MSGSVHTRSMRESDIPCVAEIHIAAWRTAYEGIVRRERMDALSVAKAESTLWLRLGATDTNYIVCEVHGELTGFVSHGPVRDVEGLPSEPGVAEIHALYVHPDHWGDGCGRALVQAVRERLRGDWDQLVLWTLQENPAARAFYSAVGFQEVPDSARLRPDLGARVLLYRLPLT